MSMSNCFTLRPDLLQNLIYDPTHPYYPARKLCFNPVAAVLVVEEAERWGIRALLPNVLCYALSKKTLLRSRSFSLSFKQFRITVHLKSTHYTYIHTYCEASSAECAVFFDFYNCDVYYYLC